MKPTSRKHRLFIDANILISGLFFRGPEKNLLRLGILNRFDLVTCDYVIMEVNEVIGRKFPESANEAGRLLSTLKVIETETGDEYLQLIRDRRDAPVLATALKSKSDYLITGDKDFHTPEIKKKLKALTAKQFLNKYMK